MDVDTTANYSDNYYPYEWPTYQLKTESKCSKCGQDIKTEFKKEYWVTIDTKNYELNKRIWMWNKKLGNC